MGGSSSKRKPKLVIEDETNWDTKSHTTNIETAAEEKVSWFKDRANLYLCYYETMMSCDVSYKYFIITDKIKMFGIIDSEKEIRLLPYTENDKSRFIEIEHFRMSKDVKRRIMLLSGPGKFNYSHALRNSEHVARYIFSGAWISYQMTGGQSGQETSLRTLFEPYMNAEQIKLINVHPKELAPNDEGSMKTIYKEVTNHVKYDAQTLLILDEDTEHQNIVVIGPTGSGKSALVNQLYNMEVVISKSSPNSVTRKCQYTQGTYNGRKVNIVDTIGMCDTVLSPEEVYNVVKDSVKANMVFIDKVVVVCYGRIQKDHKDSIGKFMEWLRYEKYKTNFIFVYNKQEGVPMADRQQHLVEMCSELGVDMTQNTTITSPDGSRKSIKYVHSLGIKPGTPFDSIETELIDFTMAVLSKSEQRIKVTFGNEKSKGSFLCTIL